MRDVLAVAIQKTAVYDFKHRPFVPLQQKGVGLNKTCADAILPKGRWEPN
jgi:hypothetical protein